jgi:hypothetical protein
LPFPEIDFSRWRRSTFYQIHFYGNIEKFLKSAANLIKEMLKVSELSKSKNTFAVHRVNVHQKNV